MSSCRVQRKSPSFRSPFFIQHLKAIDVRWGGIASLECRVAGFPKPEVRWEKGGKMVANSRYVHTDRSGDKCLLRIKSIQPKDAGPYSCVATNIMGSAISTAEITNSGENERRTRGVKPPILKVEKGCASKDVISTGKSANCKTQQRDSSLNPKSQSIRALSASPSRLKNTPRKDQELLQVNGTRKKTFHIKDCLFKKPVTEKLPPRQTRTKTTPKPGNTPERARIPSISRSEKPNAQKSDQRSIKTSLFRKVPLTEDKNVKGSMRFLQGTDSTRDTSTCRGRRVERAKTKDKFNSLSFNAAKIKENTSVRPGEKSVPSLRISPSQRHSAKNGIKDETKDSTCPPEKRKSIKLTRQKQITEEECCDGDFVAFEDRTGFEEAENAKNTGSKRASFEHQESDTRDSKISDTEKAQIIFSAARLVCPRDRDQCGLVSSSAMDKAHSTTRFLVGGRVGNQTNQTASESRSDEGCEVQMGNVGQKLHERTHEKVTVAESRSGPSKTAGFQEQKASPHSSNASLVPSKACDSVEGSRTVSSIAGRKTEEKPVGSEIRAPLPLLEANEEGERENSSSALELTENGQALGARKSGSRREDNLFDKNIRPCTGSLRFDSAVIEEECELLVKNGFLCEVQADEGARETMHHVESNLEHPVRIVRGPQSVTVLRGESVTLAAHFTGVPQPSVTWAKGGKTLICDGRVSILAGRDMSVLTICDVTADDSGKYVVSVENSRGGDSCFASMAVVGIPEPPGGQPTASDVTDHSLVLSWYGSMYDGGSVVTGYVIEMCTLPGRHWHRINNCVNTSYVIQGLSQGQYYVFRVRAENRYGLSNPSQESEAVFLEDTSTSLEEWDNSPLLVQVEAGSRFSEQFELKEEVGKGKFGTVYRCIDSNSGRPRAAKIIRCLKSKDKVKVQQEIDVMNRLRHPKLMQILAAFESGRNMIMVMEFISGGELFERVIADDFVLTEHDCVLFMQQICDGVAYMHKSSVLHLDLKPENILCKTRTSHQIKIIDFGLARIYNPEESLRVLFGTREFVAPEVINYEPVLPASDMWSVGVLCYVLLSGLSPFMGDSDSETFANITRGEVDFDDEAFDTISEDAKDFISRLLIKRCKERMSAEDCLKHVWLTDVKWEIQDVPLSTEKLKKFFVQRKWQKTGTAIRALGRMVSLSRSSMGSSTSSLSPLPSPKAVIRNQSEISRSETSESGFSEISRDSSISELLS